jgi:peroxiredoxin
MKYLAIALLGFVACADPSGAPAHPSGAASSAPASGAGKAEIGKPAPAFTLKDLDGKSVSLADFKGKTVVLEWFNPDCPYVKKAHTAGSLVDYAKRSTSGDVVWLAINSAGQGKQGYGAEANRNGIKAFALTHPVLLDESGDVGRSYGATNTPHMYVIDKTGVLVYAGAIDNSPDGEGQTPEGGKLVNHVDEALRALRDGTPIATPTTKAYGCSVKYGS